MAAGLYLLLMWGYMILQSPQLYAVYAALIMSISLLFWVNEARVAAEFTYAVHPAEHLRQDTPSASDVYEPTLDASIVRLDALKSELTQQYAQFGKDQSSSNIKGLGKWHPDDGKPGRSR